MRRLRHGARREVLDALDWVARRWWWWCASCAQCLVASMEWMVVMVVAFRSRLHSQRLVGHAPSLIRSLAANLQGSSTSSTPDEASTWRVLSQWDVRRPTGPLYIFSGVHSICRLWKRTLSQANKVRLAWQL